jgi:hypothetical protein
MPNKAARPWKMLLPLASVLIIAFLWSGYWFVAISFAKAKISAEREMLARQGMSLACTSEAWGGFPFRFEFTCSSPVLKWQDKAEARSGNLLAVALAYNPWQTVFLIDGPTTVLGRNTTPITAQHERIIASVTLDKNYEPRVSSDIPKLTVSGLLTADRIMLHTRPEAEGSTGLAASAAKLNYQPEGQPPLLIDEGSLAGVLQSDMSVKADKIELSQKNVRYWGSGLISLDKERRVSGKLSTETNDLDGLLRILEPHVDLSDQEKAGFRTVLGLLGNEAKADIIAKDGQLFIGPFKAADLPPLY